MRWILISLKRKDLCVGSTGNIMIGSALFDFIFCKIVVHRYTFMRIPVYGLRIWWRQLLIEKCNNPYIYHNQPWVYLSTTYRCDVCLLNGDVLMRELISDTGKFYSYFNVHYHNLNSFYWFIVFVLTTVSLCEHGTNSVELSPSLTISALDLHEGCFWNELNEEGPWEISCISNAACWLFVCFMGSGFSG